MSYSTISVGFDISAVVSGMIFLSSTSPVSIRESDRGGLPLQHDAKRVQRRATSKPRLTEPLSFRAPAPSYYCRSGTDPVMAPEHPWALNPGSDTK